MRICLRALRIFAIMNFFYKRVHTCPTDWLQTGNETSTVGKLIDLNFFPCQVLKFSAFSNSWLDNAIAFPLILTFLLFPNKHSSSENDINLHDQREDFFMSCQILKTKTKRYTWKSVTGNRLFSLTRIVFPLQTMWFVVLSKNYFFICTRLLENLNGKISRHGTTNPRVGKCLLHLKLRTCCLPVELPGVWGGEDSYKPSPPGKFFSGVT